MVLATQISTLYHAIDYSKSRIDVFPVHKPLCRYTKQKSKHNQKTYFQIQPSVKINTSSSTAQHCVPSKTPGSGPSTFTPLNPIPSPTNRAESNENNANRNTLHYFHHLQKPASTSARQTSSANTECGPQAISYVIGISRIHTSSLPPIHAWFPLLPRELFRLDKSAYKQSYDDHLWLPVTWPANRGAHDNPTEKSIATCRFLRRHM